MNKWFKSGTPWIWMTAGAVSLSLIAVVGLLLLIGARGLVYFWPHTVYQFGVISEQGIERVIGEIHGREMVPRERLIANGVNLDNFLDADVPRYLVKTGNREFVNLDFRTILESEIKSRTVPEGVLVLERAKNGNFYGFLQGMTENGQPLETADLKGEMQRRLARVLELNAQIDRLQKVDIGAINHGLERLRMRERALQLQGNLTEQDEAQFAAERAGFDRQYSALEQQLMSLREQTGRDALLVKDMRGEVVTIPMSNVMDAYYPNDMHGVQKVGHWFHQVWKFLTEDPREANTEGGVFPAIFGTVFMVLLMSVLVTPLGVVAAIYLHEYAGKNAITKVIRIAVINLAGVPSIVYGVFGLGFFVYMLGGSIDKLFYPEALPTPTFGTPGVMWAAITLAILTLPVVIVSTEEGLSRIPSAVRQGSLALGATKAETLWRIVIPMASPAIMTGLILAVARAAGETAPLMLVGVVKLAPTLPVDLNFPYVHLDRKFMHLGFHIYDVGFQSPNVEAARPLVFATSFLLVTVIVGLNLTAIGIRNHLREKYRSMDI
ncbi:MAG: phosphate ABC transporter permease PstA [Plesiomonas shigelloides]|uniref:phosphate ABC transporter permease PstA n=1 Tax=Plesiomonas shigelloides TaxID=703 RepID=UPI00387EF069